MINTKFNRVVCLLAMAFVVFTASQDSFAKDNSNGSSHRAVTGSWDASIDFFGAVSRAMYSFHRDGTLTEADNPGFDPNFNGDALSPGIGAWERTSRRNAVAKYQKFAYDVSGQLTQIYVSTIEMKLKRDGTLSGTISIVVSTPDGTVVSEIPGIPFTATRITVDKAAFK